MPKWKIVGHWVRWGMYFSQVLKPGTMENPFDKINERLIRIENLLIKLQEKKDIDQKSDEETLLNVDEAADFLQEAKATLYSRTSRREIPFYKRGKKLYFKKKELIDWVEKGRKRTYDELT